MDKESIYTPVSLYDLLVIYTPVNLYDLLVILLDIWLVCETGGSYSIGSYISWGEEFNSVLLSLWLWAD